MNLGEIAKYLGDLGLCYLSYHHFSKEYIQKNKRDKRPASQSPFSSSPGERWRGRSPTSRAFITYLGLFPYSKGPGPPPMPPPPPQLSLAASTPPPS